ncbi:MAG: aminoacyl-tRNA hydrolase [Erysipelotrichaceae bacterium]|nr:aminoacyl-tRNA hydrolase [Erysipelotrichaceae bacterium]
MKCIIGLGNPGKQYDRTRHNAGFMAIDKLADLCHCSITENKFQAKICLLQVKGEKVILVKPQTFMNLSGDSVQAIVNYYKIPLEDIMVLHDDLDLPVGKIRIRTKGSAGGQKGMNDIITKLHSQEINRIRIGIDKNPMIPVVDYVLGKIPSEQMKDFEDALSQAAEAAYAFIDTPIEKVMNTFNKK